MSRSIWSDDCPATTTEYRANILCSGSSDGTKIGWLVDICAKLEADIKELLAERAELLDRIAGKGLLVKVLIPEEEAIKICVDQEKIKKSKQKLNEVGK